MRARAIMALQTSGGQFHLARQLAVIGQDQKTFGCEVETSDRHHAWHGFRQMVKNGRAAFRVFRRCDQSRRLVIEPHPRCFGWFHDLAAHLDLIARRHLVGRAVQAIAVDNHLAFKDQLLRLAARTDTCMGEILRDSLAILPFSGDGCLLGMCRA